MARRQYDPFSPEEHGFRCPSCSAAKLELTQKGVRRCRNCGRVERWIQPARKAVGNRRYQRLLARQRKKFGDLDMVLFQWVADPEAGSDRGTET